MFSHQPTFEKFLDPTRPHHLILKSRQSICLPKAMGGLGIRLLSRLNMALLARQGWNLLSSAQSLWVLLCKAKYLLHHSLWTAPTPRVATWAWRGILRLIPQLRVGACKVSSKEPSSPNGCNHRWLVLNMLGDETTL